MVGLRIICALSFSMLGAGVARVDASAVTPRSSAIGHAKKGLVGGHSVTNAAIRYCTRAKRVDFDPFRSEVSPDETPYLQAFTRPIMGKGGIIEKFYFAPSGLEMTGMIARDVVLAISGRPASPLLVGRAIARLIDLRIPTRGFRIEKVESIDEWTFKATFKNTDGVENIPGVVRELLERQSAGAKTTFWVADPDSPKDFIARHPVRVGPGGLQFDVSGHFVSIVEEGKCADAEIFDFAATESDPNLKGYTPAVRESEGIGLMFLNTATLSLEDRKAIALIVRTAMEKVAPRMVSTNVSTEMILPGELGHTGKYSSWTLPSRPVKRSSKAVRVVLDRPIPLFDQLKVELEKALPPEGYTPTFGYWEEGAKPSEAEVVVASFPMTMGRQKWMQGAFRNLGLLPLLEGAPKTKAALDKARETAAATVPTNAALVSDVEKATWEEASVGALYRRKASVLNKDSSPVVLGFAENGQVYLSGRK